MIAWLTSFRRSLILLGGIALFATACGAAATATPAPTAASAPTSTPLPATSNLPDTTGLAVMNYVQGVNYQETWELWPGKGKLYKGAEPHGMLLTTYLNPAALGALTGKAGSMPNGAIIVKENYTPDGNLDATTVMFKVSGYNPEHNDWFFTKVGTDGVVQAEGRVAGCQACHLARKDNDYIYTGPLK